MINLPDPQVEPAGVIPHFQGLHIIANLNSMNVDLLSDYQRFKTFLDKQILEMGLTNIGEVYHNFDNGGFTAVICLSESHISIHTWPERNYVTFDVFLSSYLRDNSETTRRIYKNVIQFLGASVLEEQHITR